MALTFALVTDVHFGPAAYFDGKLRKLTHHAEPLLRDALERIDARSPAFVVNLGDDIEDEGRDADLARYSACQQLLRGNGRRVINVAGNHDTVHLNQADLAGVWGRTGPLHYTFDEGGFHFVVLLTTERKDIDVRIDEAQLEWLRDDLSHTTLPTVVLMHHSASEQDLRDSRWFSRAPQLALVKERAALRGILRESGRVLAVFNGHVHRNHLDVIDGIPYVTLQSLVENLDEDAPGTAAASFAIVHLDRGRVTVRVHGNDRAAYQIER